MRFCLDTSSNWRAAWTILGLRSPPAGGTHSDTGLKLILRWDEALEPLRPRSSPSTDDTRVRDILKKSRRRSSRQWLGRRRPKLKGCCRNSITRGVDLVAKCGVMNQLVAVGGAERHGRLQDSKHNMKKYIQDRERFRLYSEEEKKSSTMCTRQLEKGTARLSMLQY